MENLRINGVNDGGINDKRKRKETCRVRKDINLQARELGGDYMNISDLSSLPKQKWTAWIAGDDSDSDLCSCSWLKDCSWSNPIRWDEDWLGVMKFRFRGKNASAIKLKTMR